MITFDETKLKVIPIDQVQPNNWNPKDRELDTESYEEVKKSLELHGFRQPCIVREINENHYEIIDGEQRYTAAKELQFSELVVYNEGKMTETQAKELTVAYQTQVPFVKSELAELVAEMIKTGGRVPYAQAKTDDLLNLMQFDWGDFGGSDIEFDTTDDKYSKKDISVTPKQLEYIENYLKDSDPQLTKDEKELKRAKVTVRDKIYITKEQLKTVEIAIEQILPEAEGSRGKALELICKNFLEIK